MRVVGRRDVGSIAQHFESAARYAPPSPGAFKCGTQSGCDAKDTTTRCVFAAPKIATQDATAPVATIRERDPVGAAVPRWPLGHCVLLCPSVQRMGGQHFSIRERQPLLAGRRSILAGRRRWFAEQGRVVPGGEAKPDVVDLGAGIFTGNCASCHGEAGTGSTELGAPNLINSFWIYGGDDASLLRTIVDGRQGWMPAWEDRLTLTDQKCWPVPCWSRAKEHTMTEWLTGNGDRRDRVVRCDLRRGERAPSRSVLRITTGLRTAPEGSRRRRRVSRGGFEMLSDRSHIPPPDNPHAAGVIPKVIAPLPRENVRARKLPWQTAFEWLRAGWSDL